jgi:hypothetical protein
MSERNSFVTERIRCPKCFQAVMSALYRNKDLSCSQVGSMAIMAGAIHTLDVSLDPTTLEEALLDAETKPCHRVRFAILHDSGEESSVHVWDPALGYMVEIARCKMPQELPG